MPFVNSPSSQILHWFQQAMERPQLHLEIEASNRKGNNVISPIIEATNRSNNVMVEAMDHINATHIEIENR
jgi:hypothetical protein